MPREECDPKGLTTIQVCAKKSYDFEEAYFGRPLAAEKPYSALKSMMDDRATFQLIKSLLDALVDFSKPLPQNCIEWSSIADLERGLVADNN